MSPEQPRNPLVNAIEVGWLGTEQVKRTKAILVSRRMHRAGAEPPTALLLQEMLVHRLEADERQAVKSLTRGTSQQLLETTSRTDCCSRSSGHGKSTPSVIEVDKAEALSILSDRHRFCDRPISRDLVNSFVYDDRAAVAENYNITITDDNVVRGALHNDLDRFSRSPLGKAQKGTAAYKS